MSGLVRQIPGALERVGALLEGQISKRADWELGAVERESGFVEAHALVGFGRAPARLRFTLHSVATMTTVRVDLLARSRWSRSRTCLGLADALLNDVEAQCG